jgi:hypothetical protein
MTTHEHTPNDRPDDAPRPVSEPEPTATDETSEPLSEPEPRAADTQPLYGEGATATQTQPAYTHGSTAAAPQPSYGPEPLTEPAPPVWSAATAPAPRPRGPRSGTLILGLVLAVCGVAAVLVALGFRIDLQLALIGLLVLAALTLLLTPLLRKRPTSVPEDAGRAS